MNPARQRGWRRAAPGAWRVGGGPLSVFSAAGLHRPLSPRRRTASAQGGMAAHPLASYTSTARPYPTPAAWLVVAVVRGFGAVGLKFALYGVLHVSVFRCSPFFIHRKRGAFSRAWAWFFPSPLDVASHY